jgi:hypothetical protein
VFIFGFAILGAILLRPAAAQSPLAWWIRYSALTPSNVLPLLGLGFAFGVADRRFAIPGALLYGVGIVSGFALHRQILDPLWVIPNAPQTGFLTAPLASLTVGAVLILTGRWRDRMLLPATMIAGAALALSIVVTDTNLRDSTNRTAGLLIAFWLLTAISLSVRAFRRGWFDIGGRILGSWLIAIGTLYGGSAFAPMRAELTGQPTATPNNSASAGLPRRGVLIVGRAATLRSPPG